MEDKMPKNAFNVRMSRKKKGYCKRFGVSFLGVIVTDF